VVTGVGEPVARGPPPSTGNDARFTVASRWIDISGLTSMGSGVEFSALRRACYLFVHLVERRLGPAACAARVAAIAARASRVAARDPFSPPASSRPTSQRGRTMSPQSFFCARIVATRPDTPVISASAFDTAVFARSFLGRPALRRDAIHDAFGRELEGVW